MFKQVCGVRCRVPVLEIAYGLERLSFAATGSRFEAGEAEVAFSHFNLEACDVLNSLNVFKLIERSLGSVRAARPTHEYYLVYDRLLELIEIYNRAVAKSSLKKSVARLLLARLQRGVGRVASVLVLR